MAVLCSRVCLGNGGLHGEKTSATTSSFRSHRKPFFPIQSPGPNPSPNNTDFRLRKRSPAAFRSASQGGDRSRSRIGAMVEKAPGNKLVMGEVKILKRGEKGLGTFTGERDNRKPKAKEREDGAYMALGSTNRLGPDPNTVNLQIRVPNRTVAAEGLYAGSQAFSCSPPPSSVPMPGFLGKKCIATGDSQRFLQFA